jgi:hypothetical protein
LERKIKYNHNKTVATMNTKKSETNPKVNILMLSTTPKVD